MHLQKILRQVDIADITKMYESGVRAFVMPNGKHKVYQVRSRAGEASTCKYKTPFWNSSKHVEFVALDKIAHSKSCCHSTIILFRVLPASHPKAEIIIAENWALGSADMCKMCVETLKKTPKARKVSWLTPDAKSANQLRPAVPTCPVPTESFMRWQHHKSKCKNGNGNIKCC